MTAAAFAAGAAISLLALRLLLAVYNFLASRHRSDVRTMIVLGSGGHTAEMLALLQGFDLSSYQPRCYVVAASDSMSGPKAAAFEVAAAAAALAAAADVEAPASAKKKPPGKAAAGTPQKQQQEQQQQAVRRSPRVAAAAAADGRQQRQQQQQGRKQLPGMRSPDSPAKRRLLLQQHPLEQQYRIASIPRSREVGQSFASSVPTTLKALWAAASVVLDHQPDLILLNGPGTCIPIALVASIFRLLGICGGRVVYVESIARVYRLSLSGKILYHSRMAGTFFVQWEELQQRYPRAVYAGRLM